MFIAYASYVSMEERGNLTQHMNLINEINEKSTKLFCRRKQNNPIKNVSIFGCARKYIDNNFDLDSLKKCTVNHHYVECPAIKIHKQN